MALEAVHVWLARFDSFSRWREYLEERLSEDDDRPLNQFAADQGEQWYDHDWIEAEFIEKPADGESVEARVSALLRRLSYSPSFVDAALVDALLNPLVGANAVVGIDAPEITHPVSASGEGYELRFVGTYDRSPAPPRFDPAATTLNLNDQRLAELNPELFDLTNLVELSIVRNSLTSIPQAIARLQNLEVLRISDNELTVLPDALFALPKLRRLQADNNAIRSLPDNMGAAARLETLSVSTNNIAQLPDSTGDLSRLQLLDVANNELTELPDTIGKLQTLHTLRFGRNPIRRVPEQFCDLRLLKTFDGDSTRLEELPDGIARMSSLTTILLRSTLIETLPAEIGELAALETLRVTRSLRALPVEIGRLASLRRLQMDGPEFTVLPDEITALNLTSLSLPRNFSAEAQSPAVQRWLAERS